MPPADWDYFQQLPGSVEYNFEMLCRVLIRRQYGQYGNFVARANQPGVEFHLKMHSPCSLGDQGIWYGWQCRWYDLPGGRAIGKTRKTKIEKAIRTTERELPELTDWVLWTRRPLTKQDQVWFYGLTTKMRCHLWTAAEVEGHLSGEAEIYRGTYFGELVLTPKSLADLHKKAIAPIKRRWMPEVHQVVDAERTLNQLLGEAQSWNDLTTLSDTIKLVAESCEKHNDLSGKNRENADELIMLARSVSETLYEIHKNLDIGDYDLLMQVLVNFPTNLDRKYTELLRHLRARGNMVALYVTNIISNIRRAYLLIDELGTYLSSSSVAVVADAGYGKTQLSAQLTMACCSRPAGVFLSGRDLHSGQSLDDIAHRVVIQGKPVPSMEALIAAVDAAGQRARQRIPIVIDGLNEAEDPRDWKSPLESIKVTLKQYPYVLLVYTIRKDFVDESLPNDVINLEIPDFAHDTIEAIKRYFKYFKINPADAELPIGLLRHPLSLRLFCEVTNSERDREVGIEAMPRSRTSLFERYLDKAVERICELSPRSHRYYAQDIRSALDKIGSALWEEALRSLDMDKLRQRLGDDKRVWNESIVRALEQEGVVIRVGGSASPRGDVAIVYDALAGHIVADNLLRSHGQNEFEKWLNSLETVTAFSGPYSERHPLASDILTALTGLTPRILHQPLWPLLKEPIRTISLLDATSLECEYLDTQTIKELRKLALRREPASHTLLGRLWQTRGVLDHPLNIDFLDTILRPMRVAERDLYWTEWIRGNCNDVIRKDVIRKDVWDLMNDIQEYEHKWKESLRSKKRDIADGLRARWFMWYLTSTVRKLRDQATRALYWFGRSDPSTLFKLSLDALSINDSYVPERMLAASYGVVMAHQEKNSDFENHLSEFLVGLRDALVGDDATTPTNHWLIRLYVQGIATFALTFYEDVIPSGFLKGTKVQFALGSEVDPIESDDSRHEQVKYALRMDFRNYTLGRLFRDRANYDDSHLGHKTAVAHVYGTIWDLGWRESLFDKLDDNINYSASRIDRSPIERYGKKYGWIGYNTYAGILDASNDLSTDYERLSDLHIDPSFPESPPLLPHEIPTWVSPTPKDDQGWLCQGIINVPDSLLCASSLGSIEGPWIAVDGFLKTDIQINGREAFGFIKAMLVNRDDGERLLSALNSKGYPGSHWIPQVPSDYYTFAGEIPWSPDFVKFYEEGNLEKAYLEKIILDDGPPIEVEILAHNYSWEGYHSDINSAGNAVVPSKLFSSYFDLRGCPQSFNQILSDGTPASLSYNVSSGFTGDLLYLREDLLRKYAGQRHLIWFVWGERDIRFERPTEPPDWFVKIARSNQNIWRHVRHGSDLSEAFKS